MTRITAKRGNHGNPSSHWPNHFKDPAVVVVGPKDQQSA